MLLDAHLRVARQVIEAVEADPAAVPAGDRYHLPAMMRRQVEDIHNLLAALDDDNAAAAARYALAVGVVAGKWEEYPFVRSLTESLPDIERGRTTIASAVKGGGLTRKITPKQALDAVRLIEARSPKLRNQGRICEGAREHLREYGIEVSAKTIERNAKEAGWIPPRKRV